MKSANRCGTQFKEFLPMKMCEAIVCAKQNKICGRPAEVGGERPLCLAHAAQELGRLQLQMLAVCIDCGQIRDHAENLERDIDRAAKEGIAGPWGIKAPDN